MKFHTVALIVLLGIASYMESASAQDIFFPGQTERPTHIPTKRPTGLPTQRPTQQPTQRPTQQPTQRPTQQPTQRPTQQPTGVPTQQPTGVPTQQPTVSPTPTPTRPTNAAYNACIERCQFTSEYNPVCGSDGQVYTNPGSLGCARTCGNPVTLARYGQCTDNTRG